MSRKVVVTGLGAITPIGENVQETWKSALAGVSGVHALEQDWVEKYDLPVRIGALSPKPSEDVVSRVQAKRLDPSGQLSVAAAREAWTDAGFSGTDADTSDEVDPTRLGVAFGTGIGGVWTLLDAWDTLLEKGPRRVKPMTVPMLMPNGNASSVSMEFKARACAITPVSACASGTEAFYQGLHLIRSGKADVVIVGGAESAVHPPAEPPEIAIRFGSARPSATSARTAVTMSSTSTIPHRPRRRSRHARPNPVDPP